MDNGKRDVKGKGKGKGKVKDKAGAAGATDATNVDATDDWSVSRGEAKAKHRSGPRTPVEITVSSDFENLLETEPYGGCGCCSYAYDVNRLEFLEKFAKKHPYSQDVRRIMLGILMARLEKGEKELVASKIGEYGITLANYEDLMHMYRRMRCGCAIYVSDIKPVTMSLLRDMITREDPYKSLSMTCMTIPQFDIKKLQSTIIFQQREHYVTLSIILYGYTRETNQETVNATCYWKVKGKKLITNAYRKETDEEEAETEAALDDETDEEIVELFTHLLASPSNTRKIYVPSVLFSVMIMAVNELKLPWKVRNYHYT